MPHLRRTPRLGKVQPALGSRGDHQQHYRPAHGDDGTGKTYPLFQEMEYELSEVIPRAVIEAQTRSPNPAFTAWRVSRMRKPFVCSCPRGGRETCAIRRWGPEASKCGSTTRPTFSRPWVWCRVSTRKPSIRSSAPSGRFRRRKAFAKVLFLEGWVEMRC